MQRGLVAIAPSGPDEAALLARAILQGRGDKALVREIAKSMPARVQKAAQAPMATSDADMAALADSIQILTSYAPKLRNTSVFFRLLADEMMLQLPLRMRVSWITGTILAGRAGQGGAIPVKRVASDKAFIEPWMVSGILVFTKELVQFLSGAGEAFLSLEMRRAISAAVDTAFLTLISDGSTPTRVSAGGSPADAIDDVGFLLTSAELKAESRPLFIASPNVAIAAATLYDQGRVFPEMGPLGGSILNVPCVVSDSVASGVLGLIDGAGVAGDAEGFQIDYTEEAALQMNDAPDSPASASTSIVSLWQQNLVGLKPQVYFGATRLRASAFSTVTGIGWGGADSP